VNEETAAPEGTPQVELAIAAVSALDEPSRRGMYEFIRRQRRPVTREEAAAHIGISRKLAGFHLDKLVTAGLLTVAPAGGVRRVGRAPKAYLAADSDVRVSIPERQHDVLAAILIDALLEQEPGERGTDAAIRVAHDQGVGSGRQERARLGRGRLGPERALSACQPVLARQGYEPDRVTPRCIRLRSCPFHPLTKRAPQLVCGLNHAYLSGFLDGLDAAAVQAVLVPQPGECCVQLRGDADPD
jgi:predicted ArsR family transcriptional regulator